LILRISAILFDVDGTLIDTNELIIASFLHTFDRHLPGQYKREDVIEFIGPTLIQTFSEIAPDQVDEMITTYRSFNLEQHDVMIQEYIGTVEAVSELKRAGYKLGAVTSKQHDVALRGLKLQGLDQYFDCIVGSDHVKNPKPDPEPIYKALKSLGVEPEQAMMVGDRHHDILAGRNAGTLSVGVSWTLQGREYLEQYQPDFIIDEMTDLLKILQV